MNDLFAFVLMALDLVPGQHFLASDYLGMLDNSYTTTEAQIQVKAMGVSSIRTAMITYSEIEGPRCWTAALSMHGDELLGAMRRIYREHPDIADLPAPVLWSVTGTSICQQYPDKTNEPAGVP